MKKIGIIGAGASGLFAAINLKTKDNSVTLIEKNSSMGKKLRITGNGRCNITNSKYYEDFLENIITNKKFMYSSFNQFDNFATIEFFENNGLRLKEEEEGRIFPQTQKSYDVINFFKKEIADKDIELLYNTEVTHIIKDEGFIVKSTKEEYYFDYLIIATGGLSYSATGSSGDGYKFARSFGHVVTKTYPSLVPLYFKDDLKIKALSLKDVRVVIKTDKDNYSNVGDVLLSNKLLTGPLILKLSSFVVSENIKDIYIDILPKYNEVNLDKFLLEELNKNPNKVIANIIKRAIPEALGELILNRSSINVDKKANQISKKDRRDIIHSIKKFTLEFDKFAGFNSSIITKGGVDVEQIDPTSMESKKITNLFFIGEVLDIDALSGGFNLQIAFSTAFAAAKAIKERL